MSLLHFTMGLDHPWPSLCRTQASPDPVSWLPRTTTTRCRVPSSRHPYSDAPYSLAWVDKHTSRWLLQSTPLLCSTCCTALHCTALRCDPSLFLNRQKSSSLLLEVDKPSGARAEQPGTVSCCTSRWTRRRTASLRMIDSPVQYIVGSIRTLGLKSFVWLPFSLHL